MAPRFKKAMEQYVKAPDSNLDSADLDHSDYASQLEKNLLERDKAHTKRVKDDQRRLTFFYRTAIGIIIGTFLATLWMIYLLVDNDKLDSAAAIAFFASVTAQVISLAHIIAKYFFPEGGGLTKDPNIDN